MISNPQRVNTFLCRHFFELLVFYLDSENKGFHPIRCIEARREGRLAIAIKLCVFEEVEGTQRGNVNIVLEGEGRDIPILRRRSLENEIKPNL
jgi:hypothetical protein